MNRRVLWLVYVAFVASLLDPMFGATCLAAEPEKMLSHDVYFGLKDNSPQAKKKLIAACKKYLSGHPGTIWFAVGPLGEEFQRDVNDRDFDVALHVVFKNKAAHDEYSKAERHMKFIEETKADWAKVRVFDSYVAVSSHEGVAMEGDRPAKRRKPALPDAAAGFAGMIQGKVVQKLDGGFTIKVEKIVKEWEHNKAKDSKSLVGKTVVIKAGGREGNVARFVKMLKVGEEEVSLDVADKGGEALTILELTEDQRERVKAVPSEK
jgi:hypothetical protein